MKQIWYNTSPSNIWLKTFAACQGNPNLAFIDCVNRADAAMAEYHKRFGSGPQYASEVESGELHVTIPDNLHPMRQA